MSLSAFSDNAYEALRVQPKKAVVVELRDAASYLSRQVTAQGVRRS
jgi:sensor histidine kinase regulating citrate/malate metabolism